MNGTLTQDVMETGTAAACPVWLRRVGLLPRHVLELLAMGIVLLRLCAALHTPFAASFFGNFDQPDLQPLTWQAIWGLPALVALTVLAGYALRRQFQALFALFVKLLERPFYLFCSILVAAGALYNIFIWTKALNLRLPDGGLLSVHGGSDFDYAAGLLMMVMLIAARFFKRPVRLGLFLFTLIGCAFGLVFYLKSWPVIVEVKRQFNDSLILHHLSPRPGMMVSVLFMPLGWHLHLLVPLLAAFYGIRRGFAWWKYLLGWAAGFFLSYLVLRQSLPGLADMHFILLGWLWLALLARLPLTRRNLETLLGVPLCEGEAPAAARPSSVFGSLAGHAMACVLGLLLLAFGVVCHYERKLVDFIDRGAEPPHYSPALVNAYDALKAGFSKKTSAMYDRPKDTPEYDLLETLGAVPRPFFEEALAGVDISTVERQLAPLQPGFDAFARAAQADYCLFHNGERVDIPNFVNLRVISRGLMVRANLRLAQGRNAEAVGDIETLYKIAGLLNTDPCGSLVHHMIAVAIRGIAQSAAQNYFFYYRHDPAALEPLRAMLERNARWVRVDFPEQIIARTEPGFWAVVPCFEVIVPGLVKAGTQFYGRWIQYDFTLLAIALESYKRDHGAYPATLDALAPAYLARLPRDPVQGLPYLFDNMVGEFKLRAAPLPGERESAGSMGWMFTSTPDVRVQRTFLERYKARKAGLENAMPRRRRS